MKKILFGGIVLLLSMLQLPASAMVYDQWGTLQYGFDTDWSNLLQLPLMMGKDITAPSGGGNISTNNPGWATIFQPSGYTLTGTGTGPVIWVNEDCAVVIDGSGTINNHGSTTQPTIMNNGPLTLAGITVENGIQQTNYSNSITYIGNTSSQYPSSTTLNGNNNITVGNFSFSPGSNRSDLYFNGGTISSGVRLSIEGFMNTFHIGGGNVTINGATNSGWEEGGSTAMTSGSFTLTDFSHNTLNTVNQSQYGNNCYTQTGGTLNLTNASTLNLNDGSGSYIKGGNVNINGGSTLSINNGVSNNAASIVMSGSNNTLSIGNFSSTQTTLSLNSGSDIQSGSTINIGAAGNTNINNVLNVNSGATIESAAKINVYQNNSLNITGGNATLNNTDTWAGYVNLHSGNLNLSGGSYNDINNPYRQTGGTLSLGNTASLTLTNANTITAGANSTTTINIGTAASDASSLTVSNSSNLNATAPLANLIINVGSPTSIGNFLNVVGGTIDPTATIVLNTDNTMEISGGTVTLNEAGTGTDTLAGTVILSGGDLYLDSIVSHGAFEQTGGNVYVENSASSVSPLSGERHFHGGTINLRNNGKLTLKAPDTWTATNFNNNGGTLTLDGFTHDTTAAGKLNQTAGATNLTNTSTLTMDLDNASNALSGGTVSIDHTSTLNIANATAKTVGASLSGDGTINKNLAGTLTLTGRNSAFTGDLYVNAGSVDFNSTSGTTNSYISGTTHLAAGSNLNVNTDSGASSTVLNNISGGTVNKTGAGTCYVDANSNGNFNYNLNVQQGAVNVVTTNTANFNNPVSVGQGPGNPVATLRVSAADTNFNNGLTLSNAYMGILNNGFDVTGNMSVGSTVDTMNGVIATNNISGNLNVGASGTAEYLIDVSPNTATSDKYVIGGNITTTNPTGIIDISNFKIIGPVSNTRNINLNVFNTAGTIDPGIVFKATSGIVSSPLALYSLSSQGSGNYALNWVDYNPQVFRGQVATEAAYANQLTTNNVLFDHIGLVSQQLLSDEKPNVYANENPLFAPYQYSQKEGGLWYKAYGNLERLQLSQNINTQNNMWGSLVGADFPIMELKNGWKLIPTAYVGYTGAYQTYSGVNMYQNGGQGGIIGTFYKGNFIESLLANVGGYGNDMNVAGTRDTTGNWFAGVASKSAYNVKLPKDFILQPNMLFSYNAFGAQNWNSNYGGTSMLTNMMNGLNLAPGLNLILQKDTWSVYATTQLMFNLMNGTGGSINDISLPTVKMSSTYFSYGLGITKRFKDRLSAYGQILFSNGVRTGVGFQGGLQWKF